jgi:hypothetical protein
MANKDKGGKSIKKQAAHTLKEKRQARRRRVVTRAAPWNDWGRVAPSA